MDERTGNRSPERASCSALPVGGTMPHGAAPAALGETAVETLHSLQVSICQPGCYPDHMFRLPAGDVRSPLHAHRPVPSSEGIGRPYYLGIARNALCSGPA